MNSNTYAHLNEEALMRWQMGDVVFITLNVPGDNNHFLNQGGRNGEFEERSVANIEWLERTTA